MSADILWAGADDGPIWVTSDRGAAWTQVDGNLPEGSPVNCVVAEIEASRFDEDTAYVALDGHARDDMQPHLVEVARAGVEGAHVCDLCGADTTIGDLVAAIQQVEPNAQVRIDGEPLPFVSGLDDGALRNLVGDWPRVELDAGVAHTIESFKDLLARGLLSGEDAYRDPLGQGHHAPYDA